MHKINNFFYMEIFYFLPIFNKVNFKFEKLKNIFLSPESRNRQATIPNKHFSNDSLTRGAK